MIRKVLFAALFLLPVAFLLPSLGMYPFSPTSSYSDLLVSHLPNAVYLKQSLFQDHVIPLWSDTILSGYPFFANPLSGLYYLPGWLSLLVPMPMGFNLQVIIHMIFAGVGMYLFLRSLGMSEWAALYGGLAFEALPKLYSHLGAGHITLIMAVAWTPWLLFAERNSFQNTRTRWVLPGIVLGVIALADVRWLAYAGLLWAVFSIWLILSGRSVSWLVWLGSRMSNGILALLIAAPLLLPLMQYTNISTRHMLAPSENFLLSLPPGQLFGLVYPYLGGTAEWVLYPGAITFALVLLAYSQKTVRRKSGIWLGLIIASFLYSLGSNIPFLDVLAVLPGFDLLRVPPRMLFLSGFCLAVAAGYSLDFLIGAAVGQEMHGRSRAGLVIVGVTSFFVLFALAAWVMIDQPLARIQFAWGAVFLLIGTVAVMLGLNRRISLRMLILIILVFGLVDMISINRLSIDFRSPEKIFFPGQQAARYISQKDNGQPFRVYSPSYSIPQHVAAVNDLELADGVDPLQLAGYVAFMEKATGVPSDGYSVTLPSFASADPRIDNKSYLPDAKKLGLLNVRYVVSEFPLIADGLKQLEVFDTTIVYENTKALPRAWVQSLDQPVGEGNITPVEITITPNRLSLGDVEGPGLLVISEIMYPGWRAKMDGYSVEFQNPDGILRGISLGTGSHTIEMSFHPTLLYLGLGTSAVTWIFLIFFLWTKVPSAIPQNGSSR